MAEEFDAIAGLLLLSERALLISSTQTGHSLSLVKNEESCRILHRLWQKKTGLSTIPEQTFRGFREPHGRPLARGSLELVSRERASLRSRPIVRCHFHLFNSRNQGALFGTDSLARNKRTEPLANRAGLFQIQTVLRSRLCKLKRSALTKQRTRSSHSHDYQSVVADLCEHPKCAFTARCDRLRLSASGFYLRVQSNATLPRIDHYECFERVLRTECGYPQEVEQVGPLYFWQGAYSNIGSLFFMQGSRGSS